MLPKIVRCSTTTFSRVFAILLLIPVAMTAWARAELPLTPHVAEYKIKVSILRGKLHTEVKATEDGYSARSVLKASGLASLFVRGDVTESSTFLVMDDGVRPLAYSSSDKISKEDKFMDFAFDWDKQHVSGTINGEKIDFDLDGRVHDRVSIQYELMLDLINDRTSDEYSLLDDDELKLLQISNIGTKQIKVPYGKFEAVGIQHRKANSDRITTLWCVEKLDYLPVLMEQHRDGKLAFRAVLTKYTPTTT